MFASILQNYYRVLSPKVSYALAGRLLPWISTSAAVLLLYGVIAGLFFAPIDYQQGDGFRMI